MSDLQAYLAAKYMSGAKADAILDRAAEDGGDPTAKRRKKKRRVAVESAQKGTVGGSSGLIIDDDDGMGWARKQDAEEDEEARPGELSQPSNRG